VTIREIKDISRKENFIYYRREFTGEALYGFPDRNHTGKIEFTIETAATGKKDIRINLVDPVDYPVLPVMQGLKEFIKELDDNDKLP